MSIKMIGTKFSPWGKFVYNNHMHSLTQQTPFMVNTGRHLCMGFKLQQLQSHVELVNKFKDSIAWGLEEAKAALAMTHKGEGQVCAVLKSPRIPAPKLKPDDLVWVDNSNIQTTCPLQKLGHHNLRLYLVERCIGHPTASNDLPPSIASTPCS
jgi:hypothetical protein